MSNKNSISKKARLNAKLKEMKEDEQRKKDIKRKKVNYIVNIFMTSLVFLAFLIVFLLNNFINESASFSSLLLIFTSSYTIVMEIDSWLASMHFKNKIIMFLKFVGPFIGAIYLFLPISTIFTKLNITIEGSASNTISLSIMIICVFSYVIRSIYIYCKELK